MNFEALLAARAGQVDQALDQALPGEETYPAVIHRAMRYSVFAGGKRLRPVLVLGAAETVGGRPEDALPAAVALEMVHTYSLIHDDLPAMDNDDLRRGRPTSHRVFGEGMAVLAGDALLTMAFERLAGCGAAPEVLCPVILELARAAGVGGMIGGQVVDTASPAADAETVHYIHTRKTGALIRCAVRMGALLGGCSDQDLAALTEYGDHLGLAFQIVDDILGEVGEPGKMGKPAGRDRALAKATYPAVYGLEGSRREAARRIGAAQTALAPFGERAAFLAALAEFCGKRDH
ncbi:MAG: polyprenyl synthetase family protein [Peptococcaceae bacterium]|nr:polyprenyl synthetase family protein [Peptococcaceae bacterium]